MLSAALSLRCDRTSIHGQVVIWSHAEPGHSSCGQCGLTMAFLMSGAAMEEKRALNTCCPGTRAIQFTVLAITCTSQPCASELPRAQCDEHNARLQGCGEVASPPGRCFLPPDHNPATRQDACSTLPPAVGACRCEPAWQQLHSCCSGDNCGFSQPHQGHAFGLDSFFTVGASNSDRGSVVSLHDLISAPIPEWSACPCRGAG